MVSNNNDGKRKRTRSEKGMAYDEMLHDTKSPKTKKVKLKVSQKIVFSSDTEDTEQVNNNANIEMFGKNQLDTVNKNHVSGKGGIKHGKVKNAKTNKVIDPCFQRVWRQEMALEKKLKATNKAVDNANFVLQETAKGTNDHSCHRRDGVTLDVDGDLEELDYVDDVVDDELSDYEEMTDLTDDHDKE